MTIKTYSAFTYGHTITDENKFIDFNEGFGQFTAELSIGSYTLNSFVNEIATQLNKSGTLTYTSSVDRATRKITINSSGNYDLLISSGTNSGVSAFSLMGFTGADLTGLSDYTANISSGEYFEPQYLLQSYTPFENNVKTTQASVNQTASGAVEVVSYGRVRFMECNITMQTNIVQKKGSIIKNDPQGETSLRNFLNYATSKAPIEFIPNIEAPEIFTDCILESTLESKDGVDYKLRELYAKGFSEWYESGSIVFRELI